MSMLQCNSLRGNPNAAADGLPKTGLGRSLDLVFSLYLSRFLAEAPDLGTSHAFEEAMQAASTLTQNPTLPADDLPACDTNRRFVRVIEQRADGLVAFEFAIGWPELSVELLLPAAAFAEFCAKNQVQRLDH